MGFVGVLIALFIWVIASYSGLANSVLIPTPVEVLISAIDLMGRASFYIDLGNTIMRCIAGITLAVFIGVPFGLFLGHSQKLYAASEMMIDFFRSIPATALFPLAILLFGIGNASKIGIVTFSCALVMMLQTYYGVINASNIRKEMLNIFGATRWQIFKYLLIWEAMPYIFAGMRIAVSLALVLVIVTEMFIGTDSGLGKRIMDAQAVYELGELYSTIIFTGLLGYALNKGFVLMEGKVIHWKGST